MTANEYIQLKAFARSDGALLALLWTASFACYVLGLEQSVLSTFAFVLAVATPFFVARRLRKFRDNALDGQISFKRAWAYTLLTFFDASLLFAAVHFVYFTFLDNGYFATMLTKMMTAPENVQAMGHDMTTAVMQALADLSRMRPIDLALNIMMSNIFIGIVLSLPIAAIGKQGTRKKT